PEAVIFQVEVRNEVFAAPSIRIEAIGEITEGSDWHKAIIGGQRSAVRGQKSRRQPCYFFSDGAGVVAGRSEFQMSFPHFQVPPFFSQTSQYLPRSLVPSFIVSSYVPLTQAMSLDFASSTRVAVQLTLVTLPIRSFQRARIASLVFLAVSFGGRTTAS